MRVAATASAAAATDALELPIPAALTTTMVQPQLGTDSVRLVTPSYSTHVGLHVCRCACIEVKGTAPVMTAQKQAPDGRCDGYMFQSRYNDVTALLGRPSITTFTAFSWRLQVSVSLGITCPTAVDPSVLSLSGPAALSRVPPCGGGPSPPVPDAASSPAQQAPLQAAPSAEAVAYPADTMLWHVEADEGHAPVSGFGGATPMSTRVSIEAESRWRRPAEQPAALQMDAKRRRTSPAAGQSQADASAAAQSQQQRQPQQPWLAPCASQVDAQLHSAPHLRRSLADAVPASAGAGATVSMPTATADSQHSVGASGQLLRAEPATVPSAETDELLASHGIAIAPQADSVAAMQVQAADSERLPEGRPLWSAAEVPSQLPERVTALPAQMPSATTLQPQGHGTGGTAAVADTSNTCEQRKFTAAEAMRFIAGKIRSHGQLSFTDSHNEDFWYFNALS